MPAPKKRNHNLGPLPHSDRNAELQELSLRAISNALPAESFVFRRERETDTGVDGTIEIKQSGDYTGMRSYVQLKSCEVLRRQRSDGTIAHSIETSNLNYLLNTPCPLYLLYDHQGKDIWYAWAGDEALRIEKEKPGWRKQKTVTLLFRKKLTEQSVQEVHQRIRTETTIVRGTRSIFSGASANDATTMLGDEQTRQDAEADPEKIRDLLRSCLTEHASGAHGNESNGSGARGSQARASRAKRRVAILSSADREALGMIVTSRIPFPLELYKSFFPDTDWAQRCRSLARYGLVERKDQSLVPSNEARKAILSDEFDSKRFAGAWIERFESLKEYPDIALYLAAHYLGAGRLPDAVLVLSDLGNAALPGRWNETCLDMLELFAQDAVMRKLDANTRLRLSHAMAVCKTEAGDYQQAIAWFDRVRKQSLSARDPYWLGQYYINSGIAYARLGDMAKAALAYQRAIAHGEKIGDSILISRSLGNLAQLRLSQNEPDAAVALIKKSIALKRKQNDPFSLAMAYAQLGTIEAQRGHHPAALQHLQRAEKQFAKLETGVDLATTHFNLGNVYYSMRQLRKARDAYRRAIRLAAEEECPHLQMMATQGFAQACHALKRFDLIETAFREMLGTADAVGHIQSKISAYYGIGISQKCRGLDQEARVSLRQALRLARKNGQPMWLFKSLVALASPTGTEALPDPSSTRLSRMALQEEKRGEWDVASKLWELTVRPHTEAGLTEQAEAAFSSMVRCMENAGASPSDLISLHLKHYVWRRRLGFHVVAIESLDRAEIIAAMHRLTAEQAKIIDEKGVCYQWLQKSKDALPLHKKAVRLARKYDLPTQLRISLNNLGEAFRHLGKTNEAVMAFEESEMLSRAAGDFPGSVATAVNRALALEEGDDLAKAAAVLQQCRSEARKRQLWREYASVLESLGNLAWRQARLKRAGMHYLEALRLARRHRIADMQIEIAVNYASLMQELGNPRDALNLLKRYEPGFPRQREPYVCYQVLADLCAEYGDTAGALKYWLSGQVWATSLENADYIAICSAGISDIYEYEHKYNLAAKELERAMMYEHEPEGQATLLTKSMRVHYLSGDDQRAEQIFSQVQTLCMKHDLLGCMVDAHITASSFEWDRHDKTCRVNALMGYMIAVFYSIVSQPIESVANVQLHIIRRLVNPNQKSDLSDYESMLEEARNSFLKTIPAAKEMLFLVFWPFEVIRTVLPFVGDENRLSKELQRAMRSLRP